MQLTLSQVIPTPLKDKVASGRSGIWNQQITFGGPQAVFIQAPSGTGKTTLVHILYGMRKDFTGDVAWDGQSLTRTSSEKLSELRTNGLSVIFQDMRLFPDLTAWQNLEIKRQLTNTITAEEAKDWMNRLGLSGKMDALGSTLSYGEQQRIAIVRALLQPFSWLLMDEPFSHLDHANTEKAVGLIDEVVKARNASMLMADLDNNDHFKYDKKIML